MNIEQESTLKPLYLSVVVEMETAKLATHSHIQENLGEILRQLRDLPAPGGELLIASAENCKKCPKNCRNIVMPGKSYYSLKNGAMQHVRGEIILFLDSDCKICDGYLETMLRCFEEDPELWCVAGVTRYAGQGILSRINTTLSFGYLHNPEADTPQPYAVLAHNVGLRADHAAKLPFGNWYGRVCGDRYLTHWYKAQGHPAHLRQDLLVLHEDPSLSLPLILERHLREHLKHVRSPKELKPWTEPGLLALRSTFKSINLRRHKIHEYGEYVGLTTIDILLSEFILWIYFILDLTAVGVLLTFPMLARRWLRYQNGEL